MIRRRFVLVTALAVLFGLGWWAGQGVSRDLYPDLDMFVEVLRKIEVHYVDPVQPRALIEGAIQFAQDSPYPEADSLLGHLFSAGERQGG